jgi:hypothetical protein
MRSAYKIQIRKAEGKKIIERHMRRWDDRIKTDLKEPYIVMWIGLI